MSFLWEKDGDGHLFWECTFSLSARSGIYLSLLHLAGLGAFFGMVSYLDLVALVIVTLGLPPSVI